MRSAATRFALTLATLVPTLLPAAEPAASTPVYRIVRGEIRVVCPLTVGGSFEAKTSSLSGTLGLASPPPAALSGELRVDLSSLETGIALRNTHLRDNYLEVGRGEEFAHAILSRVRLDKLEAATAGGQTPFRATLLLHGTRQPVTGQADIRREGSDVRVAASFPVHIDDHGIAPPRYLGVGVKNEVHVKVSLVAAPVPAGTAGR